MGPIKEYKVEQEDLTVDLVGHLVQVVGLSLCRQQLLHPLDKVLVGQERLHGIGSYSRAQVNVRLRGTSAGSGGSTRGSGLGRNLEAREDVLEVGETDGWKRKCK